MRVACQAKISSIVSKTRPRPAGFGYPTVPGLSSASSGRPKGRSPAYPSINLETAIQRARQLYDKERQHPTPVTTIASYWNYKSLNGPAAQTIAALKKYGLLDDEDAGPSRKARLSALADIILVHPDEARRKAAIQEAALRPAIHQEMWEKYHQNLPSDRNLQWELTHDRGFTETGASEFIPVYKATIAFAHLADTNSAPEHATVLDEQDVEDRQDHVQADNQQERGTKQQRRSVETDRSYAIPLIDSGEVVVQGHFPITERDWTHFIAVLTAMKPGLVAALSDEDADH